MEATYFRASYWDDNFIDSLSTKEGYLYIYLFTNRYTKPSGVYKLNMSECILKSKLKTKGNVIKILNSALKDKVFMFSEWIFVKNLLRKSFNLPCCKLSDTIKGAIEKQFLQERVPIELIACFHSEYDTLSIPYPYPMGKVAPYILDLGFRNKVLGMRFKEVEEIVESTTPPSPEITPEKLKNLWNENRSKCPEVKILTPERRDKCNSRIKEQPTFAYWQAVCANVKLSGFLQGLETNKDHPNWKANFDWLIDNGKNHVKVYEGNYSNSRRKPIHDGAHPPEPKKEYKPPKPKNPKADSLWQLVLEKLKNQIKPESLETWFAVTVGYDETGDKLLVAVPNQIFANWIPDHYAEMIQKALPDREVEFVVVPAMGGK